jgi:hypothetical protein
VLLVLPPPDHLWTNVCARARDAGRRAELRITAAAAQTRMVSVARIRLVSRKSTRLFKGIICDDISEFESHMPSQPVGSLCAVSGLQKYVRHSRELAHMRAEMRAARAELGRLRELDRARAAERDASTPLH